jgi:hypothetical protein
LKKTQGIDFAKSTPLWKSPKFGRFHRVFLIYFGARPEGRREWGDDGEAKGTLHNPFSVLKRTTVDLYDIDGSQIDSNTEGYLR